jgi:hypothetical protein
LQILIWYIVWFFYGTISWHPNIVYTGLT